eukprot:1396979-Pleurochrysis_carterae.AAC.1
MPGIKSDSCSLCIMHSLICGWCVRVMGISDFMNNMHFELQQSFVVSAKGTAAVQMFRHRMRCAQADKANIARLLTD